MRSVEESSLPQSLVDGVKGAVIEVLDSICGSSSECTAAEEADLVSGMVGVISLIGQGAWSMMVGLPKDTAVAFAKQFTGSDVAYDSRDMGDVVGKLANMIAGQAAGRMEAVGMKATPSLPAIARGDGISVPRQYELPSVSLGFKCPQGVLWVRIASARRSPSEGCRPPSSICRS